MTTCAVCRSPLPPQSRSNRRTCSGACRMALSRSRANLRQEVAFDLLLRQTIAVQDGDTAALAALAAEAARLLDVRPKTRA